MHGMVDVKCLLNARFLRSEKYLASYVTDACTCAQKCSSIVRKFNQNLNTSVILCKTRLFEVSRKSFRRLSSC